MSRDVLGKAYGLTRPTHVLLRLFLEYLQRVSSSQQRSPGTEMLGSEEKSGGG